VPSARDFCNVRHDGARQMIIRAEVDVAVANAASKAILRAAVEEWVSRHPHIHYFPSYEIVLCSDPRRVWMDDFRHVTPEIIRHIGKLFLRKFAGAEAGASASKTASSGSDLARP